MFHADRAGVGAVAAASDRQVRELERPAHDEDRLAGRASGPPTMVEYASPAPRMDTLAPLAIM